MIIKFIDGFYCVFDSFGVLAAFDTVQAAREYVKGV
jgi:hypothetical protein